MSTKRGTFLRYRLKFDFCLGIINICPAGQSCSPSEKELVLIFFLVMIVNIVSLSNICLKFKVFDKQHGIRKKFAEDIINNFKSFGVSCAIGGQVRTSPL